MDVFLAWYVLIVTGGVIVGRRFGRPASLAVMIVRRADTGAI